MTDTKNNDPLGIGHWPKWKQIAVFFLAVTTLLSIFSFFRQAYELYFENSGAHAVKTQQASAPPISANYNIIPDDAFLTPSITLAAFVKSYNNSVNSDKYGELRLQPCETRDVQNKPLKAFSCKAESSFIGGVMSSDGKLKDVSITIYVTDIPSVHSMLHGAAYLIHAITNRQERVAIADDLAQGAEKRRGEFFDKDVDNVHLSAMAERQSDYEKYTFAAYPLLPGRIK